MKPWSLVLAVIATVAAVFAWSVHRRNAQILAEAELWAVAGADHGNGEPSAAAGQSSAEPPPAPRPDSRTAGTPRDALPDGPSLI